MQNFPYASMRQSPYHLRCAPSPRAVPSTGPVKFFQFFLCLPAYMLGNLDLDPGVLIAFYRRILHRDNSLSSQTDLGP